MGVENKTFIAAALLAVIFTACGADNPVTPGNIMRIQVNSTAFAQGQPIPSRHAYDQEDISPDLQWSGVPSTAKSLALICDDPDAPVGTWVHWVLFNLPPGTQNLPEGVPKKELLESGALQGTNDFGKIGYGGPCPPPGKPHRYFFKLYALDAMLNLKAGAKKADVERAMKGHILAPGELMGRYGR